MQHDRASSAGPRSVAPCYGLVVAPRLLACSIVSTAVGCGGVTAAGPPDASADAVVGDAQIVVDATAPPSFTPDAGSEEPLDARSFVDVSPLPPFDASLPALPDCDAGGYFVTVDDGASVRTLSSGCVDAGPQAIPAFFPRRAATSAALATSRCAGPESPSICDQASGPPAHCSSRARPPRSSTMATVRSSWGPVRARSARRRMLRRTARWWPAVTPRLSRPRRASPSDPLLARSASSARTDDGRAIGLASTRRPGEGRAGTAASTGRAGPAVTLPLRRATTPP
jgi:hypothetical protein